MRALILAVCAAAMLSGCATDNRDVSKVRDENRDVVTGSNIPKRDRSGSGVGVMTREEFERAQSSGGMGPRSADPK